MFLYESYFIGCVFNVGLLIKAFNFQNTKNQVKDGILESY